MQRDVDFVALDDYRRDMDELGQLSANAARLLREEIDDLKRRLWLVVRAARGKVVVPRNDYCYSIRSALSSRSDLLRANAFEIAAGLLPANAVRERAEKEKLGRPADDLDVVQGSADGPPRKP